MRHSLPPAYFGLAASYFFQPKKAAHNPPDAGYRPTVAAHLSPFPHSTGYTGLTEKQGPQVYIFMGLCSLYFFQY